MNRFADPDVSVEYARSQWIEGERRIGRFTGDSRRRVVLERVVDTITAELDRRMGQTFSMAELVRAYEGAESWCQQIAHRIAPDQPWAWEMGTVADAAFHRYARRAQDYKP